MANIFQLNDELERFMEMVDEGEIPEEAIADTLEGLEGEIDAKLDDIACACKNLEALINDIKREEDALKERRKSRERRLERLREYMTSAMILSGREKLETGRNKISFRTSKGVKIANTDEFIAWAKVNAPSLLTVTVSEKPALTEIKSALGQMDIPGVCLEERKNIQIK